MQVVQSHSTNTPESARAAGPRPAPAAGAGHGVPIFLPPGALHAPHRPAPRHPAGITRSGGEPLSPHTAALFEHRLGRSLGRVRLHKGSDAAESARSFGAKAFTIGRHVVFGQGRYQPDTRTGQRLLAHELTHVVQQEKRGATEPSTNDAVSVVDRTDASERAAHRAADQFLEDTPASRPDGAAEITTGPSAAAPHGVVLQRDDDDDRQWDFSALPPSLSGPLGPLDFSADTSRAQLGYRGRGFGAHLGYRYGSNLFAGANAGPFSGRFAIDPSSGAFSGGGGFRHGGFNLGVGGTSAGGFNTSLGYGAPLLPMPSALGDTARAGAAGLHGVLGAAPDFLNDPLGTYSAQSDNIDALMGAGRTFGGLAGDQYRSGLPFGAGLRLSYDPSVQGWTFGAGLQGSF